MKLRAVSALLAVAIPGTGATAPALEQQFEHTVQPFVMKYCAGCHSGPMAAAQFDLKSYTSVGMVTADFPRWALVMERLTSKEMPPKPIPPSPAQASEQVIAWVQALRDDQVKKSAGDPGLVLARRLSNAEYNYTIRDLTGQDMQLTRQFPVDPANPAGFDNSGESLTMSPALLNKYLQASRLTASTSRRIRCWSKAIARSMPFSVLSAFIKNSRQTMRIILEPPGVSGIEALLGSRTRPWPRLRRIRR